MPVDMCQHSGDFGLTPYPVLLALSSKRTLIPLSSNTGYRWVKTPGVKISGGSGLSLLRIYARILAVVSTWRKLQLCAYGWPSLSRLTVPLRRKSSFPVDRAEGAREGGAAKRGKP